MVGKIYFLLVFFLSKIKNSENFRKYFTISGIETLAGLSIHYLLKVSLGTKCLTGFYERTLDLNPS